MYEAVAGETVLPLVVVIDPAKRVQSDSRLATDNAMSWLVNANQWESMADLRSYFWTGPQSALASDTFWCQNSRALSR